MDTMRDALIRQAIDCRATLSDARAGRFERCSDPELASAIEFFMNAGMADAESGDVDAPCGHFARVERWLLITNGDGFHKLTECEDIAQARSLFTALEYEYELWYELELNGGDDGHDV